MSQFAKKLRGILEKAGKLDAATGSGRRAESCRGYVACCGHAGVR